MSGHSKWSTIKRRKAAVDARRGKLFTQIIRELVLAARTGGGDPHANPRLRLAVENARANNMPRETMERAIRKGTGELEGEQYEEIRYEGYGPGGVAVMLDAVTDNRNRTVGEIRHLFARHGGNLGATGCVSYLFGQRGVLVFETAGIAVDALVEAAIEAGAEDLIEERDTLEVRTSPGDFDAVRRALAGRGFRASRAEVSWLPQTTTRIGGRDAQSMLRLFEALDEHDDVKQVYANFDISEEEMRQVLEAG